MKNKAVFLDRDGTLNIDYGYVHRTEELVFLPGVIEALRSFQSAGYLLIIITNQSGVSRGYFTEQDVASFHEELKNRLLAENIVISDIYTCIHSPEDHCICRKPSPYMINKAIDRYNVDPTLSFMFGDKKSDIECGLNAHIKSFLVTDENSLFYWAQKIINKQ